MNGKELFLGLSYISRTYIDEAERDTVSNHGGRERAGASTVRGLRRPLLVAALAALLLLLVGPGLEEKYGSGTMVWTIAVTALVTGLVQFIFFPTTVLLGASGVVFMMIVLSSFTEMGKEGIPITLILVVIFYLGGELIDSLTTADNVSRLTHIVGGLCGLVFGFSIKRRRHR